MPDDDRHDEAFSAALREHLGDHRRLLGSRAGMARGRGDGRDGEERRPITRFRITAARDDDGAISIAVDRPTAGRIARRAPRGGVAPRRRGTATERTPPSVAPWLCIFHPDGRIEPRKLGVDPGEHVDDDRWPLTWRWRDARAPGVYRFRAIADAAPAPGPEPIVRRRIANAALALATHPDEVGEVTEPGRSRSHAPAARVSPGMLARGNPVPGRLAAAYDAGTALLCYTLRGDAGHGWVVDRTGVRARDPVNWQPLAAALHDELGTRGDPRSRRSFLPVVERTTPAGALDALAESLFPAAIRDALDGVEDLIVLPVANVGTVPFAALAPFGDGRPLVERMSVRVAPDPLTLFEPVAPWSLTGAEALVVGDPAMPDPGLGSLSGAAWEGQVVARLLGTDLLSGARASEARVKRRAADADVLYLATHGTADEAAPLEGGALALATGGGQDGYWRASEIHESRLRARLAVLSACHTGRGAIHDAGVIGLARAFQLAGVPRVLMSLWAVSDEATAELMVHFVARLRTQPPHRALREAMLAVRDTRPDPADWASFSLFGAA